MSCVEQPSSKPQERIDVSEVPPLNEAPSKGVHSGKSVICIMHACIRGSGQQHLNCASVSFSQTGAADGLPLGRIGNAALVHAPDRSVS
jgi:hypothetical protein